MHNNPAAAAGPSSPSPLPPSRSPSPPRPSLSRPPPPPPPRPSFNRLPTEVIDSILSLLTPVDLARLGQANRFLHVHASSERLWKAHVQANVPGSVVTSPRPFASFRSLYIAHELHWFLPRFKIWISGKDMAGRLVLMRYDQRRGCIEGYQMLAVSRGHTEYQWPADPDVPMFAFRPEVRLHLDRPVVHIKAPTPDPGGHVQPGPRRIRPFAMRIEDHLMHYFVFAAHAPQPRPHLSFMPSLPGLMMEPPEPTPIPLPRREFRNLPYYSWWPTPNVPSEHRVPAIGDLHHQIYGSASESDGGAPVMYPYNDVGLPTQRAGITDRAFHIRTSRVLVQQLLPAIRPSSSPNIGLEEIETFATIDPHHYTPTADKPYRGIWVGDYGAHGCEFLLMHQPDDDDDVKDDGDDGYDGDDKYDGDGLRRTPLRFDGDPRTAGRFDGESDAAYAARRQAVRVNRGQLQAIKLTGDPNVPRGELSFVATDLSDASLDFVLRDAPFAGVRVIKSHGHIAGHGYRDDRFIRAQLLLISHNRMAMYWTSLQHISFFERVDIDGFLAV